MSAPDLATGERPDGDWFDEAPGPLSDPFTAALRGRQRRFARAHGAVATFDPDVSVFSAHPRDLTVTDYSDLAGLVGAGNTVSLRDRRSPVPAGWTHLDTFPLVQYTGEALAVADDPELSVLTADDVPEMADLVRLAQPGPFLPRTIEMGTYLGYREPKSGRLLAMAGQRLTFDGPEPDGPGWVEISAVCTHPDARGIGLATRLIRAVGAVIRRDGDLPFLHTTTDNPACALYERLGFVRRSVVPLEVFLLPAER